MACFATPWPLRIVPAEPLTAVPSSGQSLGYRNAFRNTPSVNPAMALLYAAFWVVGIAVQVLIIWWSVRMYGKQKPPPPDPRGIPPRPLPPPPPSPRDRCRYTRRTGTRALARARIAAATRVRRFNPRSPNLTREATRELLPYP